MSLLRSNMFDLKVSEDAPNEIGLREQNKLEKRLRIKAAARDLFSKRGYDDTTMREIARRAQVGLGTLFHYARDKRDLIFLIFNDELAAVTTEALAAPQPNQSLLEQLMAVFATHYYFFSRDPDLSRLLLKELIFYSKGTQAAAFLETRGRLLAGIEAIVGNAQSERRLGCKESASSIARNIFFVFSGHIRWWIAQPSPHPFAGLSDLKQSLTLQINGLDPKPRIA
jgi:AcrR family transcriptional regulator